MITLFSRSNRRRTRAGLRGLSLIELLVALAIGSIMIITILVVMREFESRKRRTSSINEANQSGSYAAYAVDRLVRSAGSGFAQAGPVPNADVDDRYAVAFGCKLLVSKGGSTILPRGSAFPAPFNLLVPVSGSTGTLRLAPALIASGQSGATGLQNLRSDVLVVMAGTSGYAEVFTQITGPISASSVPLQTTASFNANDLVLLVDQPKTTGGMQDCMVQQVGAAVSSPLGLTGTYAASTISGVTDSSYDDKAVLIKLGNPTTNPPNFFAIGVGDSATLTSLDLLQTRNPALQAMADNVVDMHAVYGVDMDDNGKLDSWIDPSVTTSEFHINNLMAGTPTAATNIDKIKALRVALVLRSPLQEKTTELGTGSTLTIFQGTSFARTRTLTAAERRYRYRIVDVVIPLRNVLLTP